MLAFTLVFVGAILVISGLGKFRDRESIRPFALRIGVAPHWISPINGIVVLAELLTGILLLLDVAIRWTSIAAALLASGFLVVHALASLRGVTISCRCFGAIDADLQPTVSTGRSALFLAVAVALAVSVNTQHHQLRGLSVNHLAPALGGVLALATYIVVFHLINEATVLVGRDRRIHSQLLAAARLSSTQNGA